MQSESDWVLFPLRLICSDLKYILALAPSAMTYNGRLVLGKLIVTTSKNGLFT
jgi:hypothetical protein